MRIFLVGEGRHDIGDLAADPAYRGGSPGFLQPVVEKVVGGKPTFEGAKVALLGKKRVSQRGEALEGQARVAAALAVNAESDLLIFVRDLDRGSGTGKKQAAADIKRMCGEINRGFRSHADASLGCVPGIPCRTIEAWALGDAKAVIDACPAVTSVDLPDGKDPEKLWGKPRNPESNHPKMVFKRIVGDEPTQAIMSAIAARIDIGNLREACPLSFEPFVSKLEAVT